MTLNSAPRKPKLSMPTAITTLSDEEPSLYARLDWAFRASQDFLRLQLAVEQRLCSVVCRFTARFGLKYPDVLKYMADPNTPPTHIAHLEYMQTSRNDAQRVRTSYEKTLEKLAKQLPIAHLVESTRGLGYLGIGQIVASSIGQDSTGPLTNYSSPAKLRRRFGLAPVLVKGRHRAPSVIKAGELSSDEWRDLGYAPRRRALIQQIGDSLIRAKPNKYYDIYIARKAREREKAAEEGLAVVSGNDLKGKARDGFRTLKHIDMRAKRYMLQKLLDDLWAAWPKGDQIDHVVVDQRRAAPLDASPTLPTRPSRRAKKAAPKRTSPASAVLP